MTLRYGDSVEKLFCNIYHPFIDDDHSLWGIELGTGQLKKSTDYGDSWNLFFDFATLGNGIANNPVYGCIYISRKGHIFVGLKDKDNGQGYLYRSASPRGNDFELIFRFRKGAFPNCWNITEDNDGVIFVGTYGHSGTGSVDANGKEINLGYFYKSVDDGLTFIESNYFMTSSNARHIHNIQVDPFTNVLYVTIGDALKETWVSTDKGVTFTRIRDNSQMGGDTGISFFDDSRIWGTDFYNNGNQNPGSRGYTNYLRKSTGTPTAQTFEIKRVLDTDPDNTAIYDMHALGNKWAFAVTHDEWDDQLTKRSAVWVSNDKGETWSILEASPVGSYGPVFMGIANGRNSRIPDDFPYLIVTNHWTRQPQEDNMFLSRIAIEDIEKDLGITATPFAMTINPNQTLQFTANEEGVTWIASDLSVATIDINGLLTAKKPGVVYVVALKNGIASNKCWVTIMSATSKYTDMFVLGLANNERIMIPLFNSDDVEVGDDSGLRIGLTQNVKRCFKLIYEPNAYCPVIKCVTEYGLKTVKSFE